MFKLLYDRTFCSILVPLLIKKNAIFWEKKKNILRERFRIISEIGVFDRYTKWFYVDWTDSSSSMGTTWPTEGANDIYHVCWWDSWTFELRDTSVLQLGSPESNFLHLSRATILALLVSSSPREYACYVIRPIDVNRNNRIDISLFDKPLNLNNSWE